MWHHSRHHTAEGMGERKKTHTHRTLGIINKYIYREYNKINETNRSIG